MRSKQILMLALAMLVALPAAAAELDDAIAKHIDAYGGAEAWSKVTSVRMSGDYTAFSKVAPFTLTRARDSRYLLDTHMNERKVTIGYDGETVWWDNHWFKEGAERVSGLDRQVALVDSPFVTPLFDYADRGMKAEYLGETSFEGVKSIGIKLIHEDDAEEVSYLDPKTYLAYARTAPGSDFGRPQEQRTFFDDYRKVGDVTLPYYVETQWYTRDRVMAVDNIELNVDLDDNFFAMPAPAGMAQLLPMVGEWTVTAQVRDQPGAPTREITFDVDIRSTMGNRMLKAAYTIEEGVDVEWTLNYDPHRKHYLWAAFVSALGYMDLQTGTFGEDGALAVSNVETGTTLNMADLKIQSRATISEISDGGFKIVQEMSMDGQNWMPMSEEVYAPRGN